MTMAIPPPTVEAEVICGEAFHECLCGLPSGHDPPHVCGRRSIVDQPDGPGCGGSWDAGGVVTYPRLGGIGIDVDALLLDMLPRRIPRGGIRFDIPGSPDA
jgi:hypothetical protein